MSDDNYDYTSEDTTEEAKPAKRGKVNWPTVTVAMGVSTLATGLVLMMGAFGVMHYSASITSSAVTQAQLMADQGNAGGDTSNGAAANNTQRAAQRTGSTGASEARGTAGSGSGGAGGGQRSSASGSDEETVMAVDSVDDTVDASSDMPPQMDAGSLQSHMQYLLADSTSDEEIANNLEAGYDGVPVVRQISSRLNTFSLIYKWRILDGSVYEDGTTMYAILEAELSGYGTKETDMAYYAIDGFWKMSNDSLCALAQSARAECNF